MTNSDELIEKLVTGLAPVPPQALKKRLARVVGIGVLGATVALLASFAIRSNSHTVSVVAFFVKFAYSVGLMAMLIVALEQIARPGGRIDGPLRIIGAIFAIMVILAMTQLVLSPSASYRGIVLGYSSLVCPFLIAAFGIPAFGANIWFLRQAAPTQPRLAGFIAGACAGATGAWVYSWACIENGIPFITIWYTLGILLSGLLGCLFGRILLRW
ncbi:DUF1109 domain-containing protein [Rhizobium sp. CCGE531]|uniref:NrsF family protein n=1 Tax=Rhizobium sp. CCGE531 TaxID=2364271 RepID=UPI000EA88898|nr:DUF1109 domain-containing protein [Rhizobium sp. CCGE531]AYG68996.1 DUF1109 family protein [Rhizobium sp. CCGE531]